MTGGSRGIGAAISARLASDGFAVVVNFVSDDQSAKETVASIEARGGRAVAVQADVGTRAGAQHLIATATQLLGPPAVLVNNAAVHRSKAVLKQDPDDWDDVVRVNLSGPFYCTHYALPAMYAARWGRIVYLGSGVGTRKPFPGDGSYAATKAGIWALARTLSLEAASYGITANTVIPGFVRTGMTTDLPAQTLAAIAAEYPEVTGEDVATVVSFLASDAGEVVSGEEIAAWRGGPGILPRRDDV